MKKVFIAGIHLLVHILALLFLILLYLEIINGTLGGEPVEAVIHYLGIGALRLLLLTLCISPVAKHLQLGQLNKLRRPLGLWCFTWASLHFLAWLWLDLGLDWNLIGGELVKRGYIVLGFVSWLILLTLAITSLPVLMRRLGRHWKTLHAWIYLASMTTSIHFWWSLKSGWTEPVIYLAALTALLLLRSSRIRTAFLPK